MPSGGGCVEKRLAAFAVSMHEPPPIETKPSGRTSCAQRAAARKLWSVGSTRAPAYSTASTPASRRPRIAAS